MRSVWCLQDSGHELGPEERLLCVCSLDWELQIGVGETLAAGP